MHTPISGRSAGDLAEAALFGEKGRAVDELIARYRSEPAALLTLLVELHKVLGPLSEPALGTVALKLRLPHESVVALARAHELLGTALMSERLGLCANGACAARGGSEVERVLREKGVPFAELRCQGSCDLGPIACYNRGAPLAISAARARSLAKADPRDWEDLLSVEKPVHAFKTEPRVVFANIFAKGSHQIATARRHGVYAPVEAALKRAPEEILEAVAQSGLTGAGGESRPVAARWRALLKAPGAPRYLVVNGVETEPGSFKDRVLMERDPHLVIAGSILAAYAVGANEGFVCVRAEYELAAERMRAAVDEATRAGFLGADVLGSGFGLKLRVRLLPGAYRLGETARLLEALEGRPPGPPGSLADPHLEGLFGRPTLAHNVETVAALPAIASGGGERYRALGIGGAIGTKVACLSGDLKRPGNYEVPRGSSLASLVHELGGGLAQGKNLVAVQLGGAAQPYLPPSVLDLPWDDAALEPLGGRVGSGAVVVISEKSCLWDLARRETAFFGREGCNCCPACKEGIPTLLDRIDRAGNDPSQTPDFRDVVQAMRASGCPIGRRAMVPAESVLKYFPEAHKEHAARACVCFPRRRARAS